MGGFRALATLAAACALAAHAQTPAQLRALLEKGDAEGAYQLGRRAPERLGDAEFDRAFGVAAIASGHAAEGVLTLERYMLLSPHDEGARVELARGYFLLGDDARAREEFELALARRPPAHVARVVREHLEALRAREARRKPAITAYAEVGGGYDSNPRAGVDNPVITLPLLGEVTVADTGVRVADRTLQYGAGFRVSAPVVPRTSVFAAGQAEAIRYRNEKAFDQTLFAGSAGFLGQWRTALWRAGASIGYQTLDRNPYRRTHGVFVDWGLPIGERNLVAVGIQGGRFEYAGANRVRDSDFGAVVLGWRHAIPRAWQMQLEGGVNAGRERNIFDDRQDLSRDIVGARLGVSVTPFADWTLGASGTWQRSRYREPDPILETTREDKYAAGELGLAWNIALGFSLRAELTEARNDSNLALYEYRRRTAILRGRYEFR